MYVDNDWGYCPGGGDAEPSQRRDLPVSPVSAVAGNSVELQGQQNTGFSPEDNHARTRSAGGGLPESQMTLKVFLKPSACSLEEKDKENPNGGTARGLVSDGPEVYTKAEMNAIEQHIRQYFGKIEHVFHRLDVPGIRLDICVVSPSGERDYCTLVTIGMGAHRIPVPEELAEYKLGRAELAIALPREWKSIPWNCRDERWCWPVDLLKALARLSISGVWLSRGCIVDNQKPFASNTWLRAALLSAPFSAVPGGAVCALPGGEVVHFYQVLPLYRNELNYSLEHGSEALLKNMEAVGFVSRPDRPDAITKGILRSTEDAADDILEMDNGIWHLTTLRMKRLPVDERNAFNHMTIYLRWCMEHDLMGAAFLEDYGSMVKQIKASPGSVDLRAFLQDKLNGQLFSVLFNQTGRAFASYYYGYNENPPYYPSDIDSYAVSIIGQKRNYSDEIQDEAYLFVPFDESYYQAMAKVIDRRFESWQRQRFDEDTLEPSELAMALMRYLNCECTYFPSMKENDLISAAYSYARRDSMHEGFVPVFIRADEQALWECLVMNSDPDSGSMDNHDFDPNKVEEYRKKMLDIPALDNRAVWKERIAPRKEISEDDKVNLEKEILGVMENGCEINRFAIWRDHESELTHPLILAKIPVNNPWEIFAYLPFGNWSNCPDTPDLMAAAKYWFEQYGAVPAAMGHGELEFALPVPVPEEKVMEATKELYNFCPIVIHQDAANGALADVLRQSTVWHLRWD